MAEMGFDPSGQELPGSNNPFSALTQSIEYANQMRYQAVTQYQQSMITPPAALSLQMQRRIATQSRYQYGVQGGQDTRILQRQLEAKRAGFGGGLYEGAAGMATWAVGDFAMKSIGLTGFNMAGAMGLVGSGVLGAALAYPVIKSVQNTMERQKYMHNIAADVEMYRDKLGFNGGLSMSQATALGGTLGGEMFKKGGFFNKEQQMQIHKIAVSNDLISARGQGNESGTIHQYTKNFKELIKTTEMIVKTLQTTKEGALATMSDLNKRSGFSTMSQIQSQVIQAKALGNMTGIGSQNALLLGVAGANATQGTPWATSTGAGMYQYGAFNAGMLARGGAGAYAVERAGGVAQAGATLANIQMNSLMNGPIAMRFAAYAMNNDGSLNKGRMTDLLRGNVSPEQVVSGSGDRGVGMGVSGRVLFNRNKAKLFNQMSPELLDRASRMEFELWSRNRGDASLEAKAWKFAEMKGMDYNSTELLYQSLTNSPGYNRIEMEKQAAMSAAAPSTYYKRSGIRTAIGGAVSPYVNSFNEGVGSGLINTQAAVGSVGGAFGKAADWVGRSFGNAVSSLAGSVGIGSGSGWYEPKLGDRGYARSIQYGTGITSQEVTNFFNASGDKLSKLRGVKVNASDLVFNKLKGMTDAQLKFVVDATNVAMSTGKTDELSKSSRYMEAFGVSEDIWKSKAGNRVYKNQGIVDSMNKNSIGFGNQVMASYLSLQQSANSKSDEEIKNWNAKKYSNKTTTAQREAMDDMMAKVTVLKGLIQADPAQAATMAESFRGNKLFSEAWRTSNAIDRNARYSAESGVVSQYDSAKNEANIKKSGTALADAGRRVVRHMDMLGHERSRSDTGSLAKGYVSRKFGANIDTEEGRIAYANAIMNQGAAYDKELGAVIKKQGLTETRAREMAQEYLQGISNRSLITTGKKIENIAADMVRKSGGSDAAYKFLAYGTGNWTDLSKSDQSNLTSINAVRDIVASAKGNNDVIRSQVMGLMNSKVEDGANAKKEFRQRNTKSESLELYEERKNAWEMNMNIKKLTDREGAQGRSVEQVNAPPILNYWNNKW